MKYIVEYGIPGSVAGANTVEDLQQYLGSDPHPDYRIANMSWLHNGQIILIWEKASDKTDREMLVDTLKRVWRKHVANDDNIGWDQLADEVGSTLAEVLGDKEFVAWTESLSIEKTV